MIQRKLVGDSDVIALRWCDVEAAKITTEPQTTDAREIQPTALVSNRTPKVL